MGESVGNQSQINGLGPKPFKVAPPTTSTRLPGHLVRSVFPERLNRERLFIQIVTGFVVLRTRAAGFPIEAFGKDVNFDCVLFC